MKKIDSAQRGQSVETQDMGELSGPGPGAGNGERGWGAGLAKLSAPRLHGPIPRERLFAQLDRLRQHSCVWLSAPPGAGKTTLVASFAEALSVPAFWYQCDRGDADAATLFYYLGVGYHGHCADAPALPVLAPEHLSQLAQFSRRFFQQLFAALPPGALLVLDNWQEAESDLTCAVLDEAVRQVPLGLSLLVVSRHDPPASIGALATTQLLASMPREALLFDEQETRALAGVHGVTDNRSVESLSERCQGWAAGLTLMLDSVGRTGRAISPAPGRLFDFFATQVLQGIPNAGQRTLMIVALPMRVSAALASELSQDPGAPDLLETLYRRQLFTYRSGDSIRGYHFHALFRDFLLARARKELGGAGYRDAAARAAMILATAGQDEEAFELACVAEDYALAVTVLLRLGPAWMLQGRWQLLAASVDRIAQPDPTALGWLRYWKGVALAATSTSAAIPVLTEACQALACAADREGEGLASAELLGCLMRAWALNQEMDDCIARVERILSKTDDLSAETRAAGSAALISALLHRRPGHPMLPRYADALEALLPDVTDQERQLSMAAWLVQYFDCMGQHLRAEAVRAATQRLASLPRLRPITRFNWWVGMTEHFVLTGESELARQALVETFAVLTANTLADQECYAEGTRCQVCIDAGDFDEAERIVERVRDTLVTRYRVYAAMLYWLQLWLAVAREDRAGADAVWPELARVPAAGVPIHRAFNHPVIVYLCDQGEHAEALSRIKTWRDGLAGMRSARMDCELDLMEAYARLSGEDLDGGLATLRRALLAARANRFLGTHAWIPRMMAFLFARALEHGIETDYVHDWIGHRRIAAPDADAPYWPRRLALITLGRFAILREGQPVAFPRKAPRKVIQMLKALVAARGEASVEYLHDLLWPDLEGDAQHEAFSVNLHRLRRLLGEGDALRLQDGRLTLDDALCWVDALALERSLDRQQDNGGSSPPRTALALYQGCFLPQDRHEAWSVSMRERLRSKFARAVLRAGRELEEQSAHVEAMALYRRGIESDELVEEFYQGLLRCCLSTQQVSEGVAVYRKLEDTLAAALGVKPSAVTRSLGEQLLKSA